MTGIGPDVPPDLGDPPQVGADGCFAVPTAPGLGRTHRPRRRGVMPPGRNVLAPARPEAVARSTTTSYAGCGNACTNQPRSGVGPARHRPAPGGRSRPPGREQCPVTWALLAGVIIAVYVLYRTFRKKPEPPPDATPEPAPE